MFNRKLTMLLILLVVALGAVSAVSAADLNSTDSAAADDALKTTDAADVLADDSSAQSDVSQNITGTDLNTESDSSQTSENTTVADNKLILSASKVTTTYGTSKYFKVKVTDSGKNPVKNVQLKIKVFTGKKYTSYNVKTKDNGIASLNLKKISKGTHNVVVTVSDKAYTAKSLKSSVKVNQKALKITTRSQKVSTRDLAGGVIDITVKDKSSGKRLNGISLTLKIYTGKKYKTVKLVSGYDSDDKKNGVAGIITNQYSAGTHKVVITPTSSNYKGSAKAKLVITKSAKKNFYNYHIYFTKGKLVFS